jgi:hypothetical protein
MRIVRYQTGDGSKIWMAIGDKVGEIGGTFWALSP